MEIMVDISIGLLPIDMIVEILLHLPVISLLRFKCVCKAWYALINSKDFIAKHLKRSRCNKKEVILIERHLGKTVRLKTPKLKTSFSIISSIGNRSTSSIDDQNIYLPFCGLSSVCDGIIYVHVCRNLDVLCNLATRETIILPKVCRSGDNLRYFPTSGFGYDLKNNLHKVVMIGQSSPKYSNDQIFVSYHVKVFTIGSSSWREVKNRNFNSSGAGIIDASNGTGFNFNGAIHWPGFYPRISFNNVVISLFNLSDEEFQMIPLPDEIKDFNDFLVWNGSLAVGVTYNTKPSLLDIFVMKDYDVKGPWTKAFSIDIGCFRPIRALTIWNENEIIFETRDEDWGNFYLGSYNIRKQEFKKLKFKGRFEALVYKESLVPTKYSRFSYSTIA